MSGPFARSLLAMVVLTAFACTSPGSGEAPPLGSTQQADTSLANPVPCPPPTTPNAPPPTALICSDPSASHQVDSAYFVVTGGGNDDRLEKQVAQTFLTGTYPSGTTLEEPGSLTITVKKLFDTPPGTNPDMDVYVFDLVGGYVDPTVFSQTDLQAFAQGFLTIASNDMPVGADYTKTEHFFTYTGLPGQGLTAKTLYSLDFYIPPAQGPNGNAPMSVGIAAEDDGTVYEDVVGGKDLLAGFLRQQRLIGGGGTNGTPVYTAPAFTQDKRDINFAVTFGDACDMIQYPSGSGQWINKPVACGVGACNLNARQCNSNGDFVKCDGEPQPGEPEPICFDEEAWLNAGNPFSTMSQQSNFDAPDCTSKLPTQETCNLVDDDCDGIVDEIADPTPAWLQPWHFHGLGMQYCGDGVCQIHIDNCINGVVQTCVGCTPGTPGCHATVVPSYTPGPNITVYGDASKKTNEACDNLDDDCDGQIDELTDDPNGPGIGYSTCGLGVCKETLPNCTCATAPLSPDGQATAPPCDTPTSSTPVAGGVSWGPTTAPNDQPNVCPPKGDWAKQGPEICDGLDNNCDGVVDNAPGSMVQDSLTQPYYWGPNGTENVGICKPGVQTCTAVVGSGQASWTVTTPDVEPQPDVCDGFDNDCDGYVDNVPGTKANDTLNKACWPSTLPAADENVGDCKDGTQYCNATPGSGVSSYGACENYVGPTPEVCDGTDNDCDGVVDNGLGQTTCGYGRCEVNTQNCINGHSQSCVPDVALSEPEVCNGVDDDCDGYIDNAPGTTANYTLTQYCYDGPAGTDGVGICHGGTQTCDQAPVPLTPSINNGDGTYTTNPPPYPGTASWGACQGEQLPQPEVCNGLDDNCDGLIDNPANVICGTAPNAAATLCSNAQCIISQCDAGFYDVDKVFSNGCECQDDSSVTTTGSCPATPTNLGSVALGGTVSSNPGKLPAATLSDWYQVSFAQTVSYNSGYQGTVSVSFSSDPTVVVNGVSTPEFKMEVYSTSCGNWGACGTTLDQFTFNDTCATSSTNCRTRNNAWPSTVYIQIFRVSGAPVTCDTYTLTASLQ